MEADELHALREALEQRRAEIVAEGDVTLEPNREDDASVRRDDDAQPLNEMNQVIASRRNRERTAELRRIDGALRRMTSDPDDFGLCLACEEEIATRRLQVMPWAEYCLKCQAARDPERGGKRKHLADFDP